MRCTCVRVLRVCFVVWIQSLWKRRVVAERCGTGSDIRCCWFYWLVESRWWTGTVNWLMMSWAMDLWLWGWRKPWPSEADGTRSFRHSERGSAAVRATELHTQTQNTHLMTDKHRMAPKMRFSAPHVVRRVNIVGRCFEMKWDLNISWTDTYCWTAGVPARSTNRSFDCSGWTETFDWPGSTRSETSGGWAYSSSVSLRKEHFLLALKIMTSSYRAANSFPKIHQMMFDIGLKSKRHVSSFIPGSSCFRVLIDLFSRHHTAQEHVSFNHSTWKYHTETKQTEQCSWHTKQIFLNDFFFFMSLLFRTQLH